MEIATIIVLPELSPDLVLKKAKLKAIFLKMGEKNLLGKITDGVAWQKQLRNEWE